MFIFTYIFNTTYFILNVLCAIDNMSNEEH